MKNSIYLDNNATTGPDPRVIKEMNVCFKRDYGNPSSPHSLGRQARQRVNRARRTVSSYLGVKPREIVFTSSGTESINMFIRGFCANKEPGHIVTSSVEHAAVYATVQEMENLGWDATFLAPGLWGAVTPEAVAEAIRPNTSLIVLMAANNETGVKTDIDAIATIATRSGIAFLVDAVSIVGKEPIHMPPGVSGMAISGHKFHGPKGVGALFVRDRVRIQAAFSGGGQEHNLRSGTENVAGIAGMATALDILREELPQAAKQMLALRTHFERSVLDACPGAVINGQGPRLCNTSNIAFPGVDGESLLINLDQAGIAVSHGSACSTGALEPSRILINMGVSRELTRTSLRFSLSRFTTQKEIDTSIETIAQQVARLRGSV